MNQNTEKRSVKRRLPFDVVNWLRQLYLINPYPDRFQYGTMALHCKTDAVRVQTWFAHRRASDWRRGNLCRTCRYFKSPLATEELHRLNPNSRHCVLLSMPEYLHRNLLNDTGTKLAHCNPISTATESDIAKNDQMRRFFPPQRLGFPEILGKCHLNYHQQLPYSQAAISYQKQHFGGWMPHQLPYSTQVVNEFQRQHLHQISECIPSNSIQENPNNYDGCSNISSCDRNCSPRNDGLSSQSSQIVSQIWQPNAATSTVTKMGEIEFARESPPLNVDRPSEDYSQIIYPDYMDFPHFPLPTDNVNLKQF